MYIFLKRYAENIHGISDGILVLNSLDPAQFYWEKICWIHI